MLLQNQNICTQEIFNNNSHLSRLSAKRMFLKIREILLKILHFCWDSVKEKIAQIFWFGIATLQLFQYPENVNISIFPFTLSKQK